MRRFDTPNERLVALERELASVKAAALRRLGGHDHDTSYQRVLGYAIETTDNGQDGFSSIIDLTGLTVTVDVSADRLIRITGRCAFAQAGAAGVMQGFIREGSTALNEFGRLSLAVGAQAAFHGSHIIAAPSAGAHSYKLSVSTTSGTGNVQTNSANPAFIVVEDIGPA